MNSTDTKPKSKAEREAEEQARRRAETATIVAGLKQALDGDEQLLGFTRGRLAGGIRGKISLGPEAFFAPFVNIGLTERRLIIQHINAETGRPGEILPHYYALGDIASLIFSDIETFGGDAAARLTLRLRNDQHTRLRLRGQNNFEDAQKIVEVFRSLTTAKRPMTTPTQRVCATCHHILDQPFKFCPYCGQQQDTTAAAPVATPIAEPEPEPERTYPPTPPGATEPEFLDTVPYADPFSEPDDSILGGPTLDDGLDFLRAEPAPQPTVVPETEPAVAPETEAEPEPSSAPEPTVEPEPPVAPEPEAEPEAAAAPEPEAIATAPLPEDSAFETPSEFEGWSVDPGATSAEVEPSEGEVEATPVQGFTDFTPESSFLEPVPAASPNPLPEPEPLAATTPDVVWSPVVVETPQELESGPETEASVVTAPEFEAPPAFESFAESAPIEEVAESEPLAVAPTHEGAGFVTEPEEPKEPEVPTEPEASAEPEEPKEPEEPSEPEASEEQTPVSHEFASFAPVVPAIADTESNSAHEGIEPPSAPIFSSHPAPAAVTEATIPPIAPETAPAEAPVAETSPSEDRFAALLKEIRGGETPAPSQPVAAVAPERRDGPMSVYVHIDRAPIVVHETFNGQNADEIVGKLKARVQTEVNFAMRLMINSFSNLRFAQEIVRRYNEKEKTNYPLPNSCWEFLQNTEEMGYATIQLNS